MPVLVSARVRILKRSPLAPASFLAFASFVAFVSFPPFASVLPLIKYYSRKLSSLSFGVGVGQVLIEFTFV
ncbi:hypothetical protein NEOLEDRAFT_1143476 [Neolentinus lepideus HHB14362 ss-1]|uniref:Uncharacterized protein n=1 Tax=Neolentinus lepideus HHB14362 ss-1 TaxID=1314782 RepID=A0A165MI88_9AGAM|nr:hypothetical protein NEOLEDRAFT_1143476 [Neolentinus lepideus HHB14362 ss-1]